MKLCIDGGKRTVPPVCAWAVVDCDSDQIWSGTLDSTFTSNQAEYCNTPDSPILMGDLTCSRIDSIKVGDLVVGWRKSLTNRRELVRTYVIANGFRLAPVVKIILESGREIKCTPDHRWLQPKWKSPAAFDGWSSEKHMAPAQIGFPLSKFFDPPPSIDSSQVRIASWLGGIYDGEGSRRTIAQSQDHNPIIYSEIRNVLEALQIPYSKYGVGTNTGFRLKGGMSGFIKFLDWCRPVKFRDDNKSIGKYILSSKVSHDKVVKIEPIGTSEVISLQTETGNYIAWGYASSNCALINALKIATIECATNLVIQSDSELMVRHVNGEYKCRDSKLIPLLEQVKVLAKYFDDFLLFHVKREENKRADQAVNIEMDNWIFNNKEKSL